MTRRKASYVVVFDPSSGLQKPASSDAVDQAKNEKEYGDLRIRAGNKPWGGMDVEWAVWSIKKHCYEVKPGSEDEVKNALKDWVKRKGKKASGKKKAKRKVKS